MTTNDQAKLILSRLTAAHTKTSIDGVDKLAAKSIRAIINKLTRQSGAIVFSKLTGGVLTCWRVE